MRKYSHGSLLIFFVHEVGGSGGFVMDHIIFIMALISLCGYIRVKTRFISSFQGLLHQAMLSLICQHLKYGFFIDHQERIQL